MPYDIHTKQQTALESHCSVTFGSEITKGRRGRGSETETLASNQRRKGAQSNPLRLRVFSEPRGGPSPVSPVSPLSALHSPPQSMTTSATSTAPGPARCRQGDTIRGKGGTYRGQGTQHGRLNTVAWPSARPGSHLRLSRSGNRWAHAHAQARARRWMYDPIRFRSGAIWIDSEWLELVQAAARSASTQQTKVSPSDKLAATSRLCTIVMP